MKMAAVEIFETLNFNMHPSHFDWLTICLCSRNGHMLTHRNKKPYECKAEGCGKSYCDARSLRRHTENHHSGSNSAASSSTSPAPESPLASSCIQYAPPPTSAPPPPPKSSPSQLQRLLASEPASSPTTTSKVREALTRALHQLREYHHYCNY